MNAQLRTKIAKDVVSTYKEIVGVDLDQVEFNVNMDTDFLDESLEKIFQWVEGRYPGLDIRKDGEFLYELDRLILQEEYKNWAYMF